MKYIPNERALEHREKEKSDSKLRDHLSSQRKFQIEKMFNNNPKVLELEQKYGKYLLVPLALPLFVV